MLFIRATDILKDEKSLGWPEELALSLRRESARHLQETNRKWMWLEHGKQKPQDRRSEGQAGAGYSGPWETAGSLDFLLSAKWNR